MVTNINIATKGQNPFRYLASVLWNNLLSEIRNIILYIPCRLCKDYVNGAGFGIINHNLRRDFLVIL